MGLFSIIARLGLDGSNFEIGILRAQSNGQKFAKTLKNEVGGALATVFAVDKLVQYGMKAVELGGKLTDLSERVGVSAEFLQEQGYAAEQTGSNLDEVASALEKISVARTKALGGDTGALDAFAKFGITAQEIKSARLEDIFLKIGKAFEGDANPQALVGAFRELAGKSAGALIPAMAEGLGEAAQKAHELGLVMDNEVVASLDNVGDRLAVMNNTMTAGFGKLISGILVPVMKHLEALGSAAITFLSLFANPVGNGLKDQFDHMVSQTQQAYTSSLEEQDSQAQAAADARTEMARKRRDYNLDGYQPGGPANPNASKNGFIFDKPSDPLARIGGFTAFGSPSDPVVRELQKQVRSLERIVKATEETSRSCQG